MAGKSVINTAKGELPVSKIQDNRKVKIDVGILSQQRIYAPDVLKEMVTNYKIFYPNRKIKYALLNNNPRMMVEYVLVVIIKNAIFNNQINRRSDVWWVNIATRGSGSSLLTYNYLRDLGEEQLSDYFEDLDIDAVATDSDRFEGFLNNLSVNVKDDSSLTWYTDQLGNPIGIPEEYHGLTINKNSFNYFCKPDMLPLFFDKVYNLKNQFDNARRSIGVLNQ